ncbi:unnamed protein product [Orchesella dallaii]|uniref:Uncharacterized protein n=1 Tax=Orchesella dallaii TaxID=48710 RepID=A0ABP1RX66_9HEXA
MPEAILATIYDNFWYILFSISQAQSITPGFYLLPSHLRLYAANYERVVCAQNDDPRETQVLNPGMLYRRTVLRRAIQYMRDGMERQALSSFFFGEDLPSPRSERESGSLEGEYLYDD